MATSDLIPALPGFGATFDPGLMEFTGGGRGVRGDAPLSAAATSLTHGDKQIGRG